MSWKFTHPTNELNEIKSKLEYHFNDFETTIEKNHSEYWLQDILINETEFKKEVMQMYPLADVEAVLESRIVLDTYDEQDNKICPTCGSDKTEVWSAYSLNCNVCNNIWTL